MQLYSTVVLITLVSVSCTAWSGTGISPKFWNHYKGLSFPRAIEKQNFNKCAVNMRVDSEGVTIGRYIGDSYFQVHYPPETISLNDESKTDKAEVSTAEKSYSLHDSPKAEPHETLLIFLETPDGSTKVANVAGHSQLPLALFFQDNAEADSLLHQQYDKVMKIVTPGANDEDGEQARPLDDTTALVELNDVSNAFNDGHYKTQLAALSRIHDELAIPLAVPLLASIITATSKRYSPAVLSSAVEIALLFLHDAYVDVQSTAQLKYNYGTTNIQRIHSLTKGRIAADKLPLLEFAANPRAPHLTWTANDIGILLGALSHVLKHRNQFAPDDALHVNEAIHQYANPFGACATTLTGTPKSIN